MQSNSVKIKFYFPSTSRKTKDNQEFATLIMKKMRKDGGIKYAGYLKEKDLQESISQHIGNKSFLSYKLLPAQKRKSVEKDIRTAIEDCHKALLHPDLPIFIFVYPWFPEKKDSVLFGGISAVATYYTMHLFIDIDSYTLTSLRETIAHEWSHLVFYRHHPERERTLATHIVMEGIAEIFREELIGGKPAPWSLALTNKEMQKQFTKLKGVFDTKGMKVYREVFFGNKKYQRWTGYSVGYRLVKKFRSKHPKLSWGEIIEMKPENILGITSKKRVL